MIDLGTRRPLDLSALDNRKSALVDRESPIEKPRKIGHFEYLAERPHKVVYSDIDFNGHVNSMKYLEWMADTLSPEILEKSGAFRFDINYIHEAKLGQSLTVCYAFTDGQHMFDIKKADGLSACKASLKF